MPSASPIIVIMLTMKNDRSKTWPTTAVAPIGGDDRDDSPRASGRPEATSAPKTITRMTSAAPMPMISPLAGVPLPRARRTRRSRSPRRRGRRRSPPRRTAARASFNAAPKPVRSDRRRGSRSGARVWPDVRHGRGRVGVGGDHGLARRRARSRGCHERHAIGRLEARVGERRSRSDVTMIVSVIAGVRRRLGLASDSSSAVSDSTVVRNRVLLDKRVAELGRDTPMAPASATHPERRW